MKNKAIFFCEPDGHYDPAKLTSWCEKEGFETVVHENVADYDSICSLLPEEPAVIFLPAIERDCASVKLTQNISQDNDKRVVILYSQHLPEKDFLCMAFRMGIDDAISLESRDEAIELQIRRARKLLMERSQSCGNNNHLLQKIDFLNAECQRLKRDKAKWQERLISLATSATRIASGEMLLNELAPRLLIAASSKTQAESAKDLANKMGFLTEVAESGEEALGMMVKCPPRVILTDGTLVDMDASSFAKTARKVLGDKPVMIIAWSSNAESEDRFLAPNGGIDDFILKSSAEDKCNLLAGALLGGLR